jgi:Caspase domain
VRAIWPRRHESRYLKVEVLLLSWEDDDLGVVKEVTELQNLFEDLYHYEVQVYQIPNVKPDKELKRRMLQFLENDHEDTLLILYYGGHARKSPQSNEAPIWFA